MGGSQRASWTGRFGFIMAMAGFSVGLGNIWRFPFVTGMNGGGAFLLVYLAICVLIGVPLLTIELGLGRRTQLTPIAGMLRLTGNGLNPFSFIGWLGVVAALLTSSYYVMLVGWILGYTVMIATGEFVGASPESVQATYETFTSSPVPVLLYTALVVAAAGAIVSRGLRRGVEWLAKYSMPVFALLLVGLSIRSMTFPGAGEGLAWYLTPDFSAINGRVVPAALGQAFYSIGIGMAVAFGLGSYMNRESSDVPGNAALIVAADTIVAVVAGPGDVPDAVRLRTRARCRPWPALRHDDQPLRPHERRYGLRVPVLSAPHPRRPDLDRRGLRGTCSHHHRRQADPSENGYLGTHSAGLRDLDTGDSQPRSLVRLHHSRPGSLRPGRQHHQLLAAASRRTVAGDLRRLGLGLRRLPRRDQPRREDTRDPRLVATTDRLGHPTGVAPRHSQRARIALDQPVEGPYLPLESGLLSYPDGFDAEPPGFACRRPEDPLFEPQQS